MRSRTRVQGEPVNPMLATLPLGLLGIAVFADLAAALSGWSMFATAAFWDLGAALFAALPATAVALMDLRLVPSWSRARPLLALQSFAYLGLVVLVGFAWAARMGGDHGGNVALFLVEALALGIGIAGAWRARLLVTGRDQPDQEYAEPRLYPASALSMQTLRLRPVIPWMTGSNSAPAFAGPAAVFSPSTMVTQPVPVPAAILEPEPASAQHPEPESVDEPEGAAELAPTVVAEAELASTDQTDAELESKDESAAEPVRERRTAPLPRPVSRPTQRSAPSRGRAYAIAPGGAPGGGPARPVTVPAQATSSARSRENH
jgi:uncharacterized membrane protein